MKKAIPVTSENIRSDQSLRQLKGQQQPRYSVPFNEHVTPTDGIFNFKSPNNNALNNTSNGMPANNKRGHTVSQANRKLIDVEINGRGLRQNSQLIRQIPNIPAIPMLNMDAVSKENERQQLIREIIAIDKQSKQGLFAPAQLTAKNRQNQSSSMQNIFSNPNIPVVQNGLSSGELILLSNQVQQEYNNTSASKIQSVKQTPHFTMQGFHKNVTVSQPDVSMDKPAGDYNDGLLNENTLRYQANKTAHAYKRTSRGAKNKNNTIGSQEEVNTPKEIADTDREDSRVNERLYRQKYELKQLEEELKQLKRDQVEQKTTFSKIKLFFKTNSLKMNPQVNHKKNKTPVNLVHYGEDFPFDQNEAVVGVIQNQRSFNKKCSIDSRLDDYRRAMLANTGQGVEPRLVRTRAQQARILGKSSSQCISTSPQNKPTYRQKTNRKKSDIQESDASSGEREVRALEKLTKKVFPPQARQGIQRDGLQDIQLMAIAALREKLEKDCTNGEDGLMNPMKALDCLNELQRKTCPEAYEPEIVMANRLKEEGIREEQEFWKEMDKTLFDFDDDVDNLSDVSERYKQTQLAKVQKPQKEFIERGESTVKFNDERDDSIEKKDKRSKLKTENQKQRRVQRLKGAINQRDSLQGEQQSQKTTLVKRTQELLHDKVKADIIKDLKKAQPKNENKQGIQAGTSNFNNKSKFNDSQLDGIQRSRYFKSYLHCIDRQSEEIVENIRRRRNIFSNMLSGNIGEEDSVIVNQQTISDQGLLQVPFQMAQNERSYSQTDKQLGHRFEESGYLPQQELQSNSYLKLQPINKVSLPTTQASIPLNTKEAFFAKRMVLMPLYNNEKPTHQNVISGSIVLNEGQESQFKQVNQPIDDGAQTVRAQKVGLHSFSRVESVAIYQQAWLVSQIRS
ncbi:hypothetical protein FGO68_gene930 [Halteria grandinella]|uniref:Uncharacterized protein n=1 Tax=Halteria grandinella TaxID=5974 RepID=A0A8J8T882_HALGN|nr:hypothetical protein FGO68_gene930 [Halteria grandinella]